MFHILFLSEQKKLEEKRRLEIEELLKKHQEYCGETKTTLLFVDMPSEKPAGKGLGRQCAEYISDSGGSDGGEGGTGTDKPCEKMRET